MTQDYATPRDLIQRLTDALEMLMKWEGWSEKNELDLLAEARARRRPKPPSLKEQALAVLDDAELDAAHYNILLRALEQLDD